MTVRAFIYTPKNGEDPLELGRETIILDANGRYTALSPAEAREMATFLLERANAIEPLAVN